MAGTTVNASQALTHLNFKIEKTNYQKSMQDLKLKIFTQVSYGSACL